MPVTFSGTPLTQTLQAVIRYNATDCQPKTTDVVVQNPAPTEADM